MLRNHQRVATWAVSIATLFGGLLGAAPVRAQCGGLCIYEVATQEMGESYAGSNANADSASTAFLNPAGLPRLERAELHNGFYIGTFQLEFDSNRNNTNPPPPGFTGDGGNAGSDFLPGPGSYLAIPLADELFGSVRDLTFGFAMNGIFGGSADYDNDWIGRFFITEVELLVINLNPSLGVRLNDWLSAGVGINVLRTELSSFKLASPVPGGGQLNANGADDWQVTFTLGLLAELSEKTRVGFTYRYEAEQTLSGGAPNFGYEFTFPQGLNVGIHHELTDTVTLLLDGGWSDWSEFSDQQITVGPVEIGFDRNWQDTWRIAVGTRWAFAEDWIANAGFSYDSSPVRSKDRTPDLPVSEGYRWSLGLQYLWSERLQIGATWTFLWFGHPKIDNVAIPPGFGPGGDVVLDGEYNPSWGQFFGINLTWSFCSPLPWVDCPPPPQRGAVSL